MTKRFIAILLGVFAFFTVLGLGAAAGGALVFFALQARPVRALASELAPAAVQVLQDGEAGILVSNVAPDSPAERAGLKRGDILLQINGQEINKLDDLTKARQDLQAGDTVELSVLHGDEQRTLTATLEDQDEHPFLGIEFCGFPGMGRTIFFSGGQQGAVITEVIPNGPAEQAGLNERDRILAIDGQELGTETDLGESIAAHQPGDTITLRVRQPGEEEREVTVTLGENPDEPGKAYLGIRYLPMPEIPADEGLPFDLPRPFRDQPFGEGTPFEMPELPEGVEQALIVGEVTEGSPASEAGLQEKDLITAVNGEPVGKPEEFAESIQSSQPGDSLTLTVSREGESEPLTLTATLGEDPDQEGKTYLGISVLGFVHIEKRESIPAPEGAEGDPSFFDGLLNRVLPGIDL